MLISIFPYCRLLAHTLRNQAKRESANKNSKRGEEWNPDVPIVTAYINVKLTGLRGFSRKLG